MRRASPAFARIAAIAAALLLTAPGAFAQTAIWSGNSDGFTVTWTRADIAARRGDKLAFSARDLASAGLAHFVAANRRGGSKAPDCDYERRFRIVALVGSLLSLEDRTEFTCTREAHPGGTTRLITIDLANPKPVAEVGEDAIGRIDTQSPGKAALLTQLFPPEEVLRVLTAATPIEKALRRAEIEAKTLPALVEAVTYATGEDDGCYEIPPDLLARFAFDDLDGDRVVVRLGLPGDGPCRMALTEVPLVFTVPGALSEPLRAAAAGSAGFLGKDAKRLAGDRATTITLRSGKGGVNR